MGLPSEGALKKRKFALESSIESKKGNVIPFFVFRLVIFKTLGLHLTCLFILSSICCVSKK